ncbi:hypothetical protein BKA80DRAFT_271498 [Phyllosticta citrichinensis]
MPTIQQRMFKLKEQLLWIRMGPGSATIPRNVQSISLRLARKIDGGHRGPKKFIREVLPRIKYRNPWLPIKVDRNAPNHEAAFMTVTFTPEAKRDPTRIEMKYKPESEIWSQLADVVRAQTIAPSEVELEETEEIRKRNEHSRVVREAQLAVNAKLKREKELLEAAKQQTAAVMQAEQGA